MIRRRIIDYVNHTHVQLLFLNLCLCLTVLCFSELDRPKTVTSSHTQSRFRQCAYGQCIGLWNVTAGQTRRKRNSDTSCATPSPSPDRTIKYKCNGNNIKNCIANKMVPESTRATVSCNAGYSSKNTGAEFHSFCHDKTWFPPIEKCHKLCEVLNPVNVDLECFNGDTRISCDGNSLIAGVRVRPTCKHLYTYRDFYPTYREIKCREDGRWDKTLFSCVPECGLPFDTTAITLISYSNVEHFGDSPWHVAIYNQRKILICGGTIITTRMILSAAHCFYDDETGTKLNAENYEVVVSKFTRNYTTKDNSKQKVFKIKEIRFSKRGFIGLGNRYAADIAILILYREITVSPTVLPACVYWAHSKQNLREGALGKVVGWGLNEKGEYPENLTTTNLAYIGYSRCLSTVPAEYRPFVTLDKFCAGSETGPTVLNGDSGGGLMFAGYSNSDHRSYIRGIVSIKQNSGSPTGIAAFTNVEDHIDWITEVRDEVEHANQTFTEICDELAPINVDLTCYRNNASIDCNGPLITGDRVRPTCKKLHTHKDSVPIDPELECQENGKWDNTLFSCVLECGRTFTSAVTLKPNVRTEERYGDSPWNVAIYEITKNALICTGTIINPYLIISAAHCFYNNVNQTKLPEANYEIVVGKFTRNYTQIDNPDQKVFKIKEIRFSNRGFHAFRSNYANDIAILILNGKIGMSSTVLPACVDWINTEKYSPPEDTPGKFVGWGLNDLGKYSEKLQTAAVPFISNGRCFSIVPDHFKSFITYDKFCVGSETGSPIIRRGESGGGLLFREGAFYYIRGVISVKQPSDTNIAGVTDLSDHITWIRGVRNEVEQDYIKKESTLASKG